MTDVPESFRLRIRGAFGEAGDAWLARLPHRLTECSARWDIRLGPPFSGLSYHYVAPGVRRDGSPVVLKLGVPHGEFHSQIEALRCYHGRGVSRLLAADAEGGALLMERLLPGGTLAEVVDDDAATSIAAGVMRELRRPPPAEHAFPTVAEWASGLAELRRRFDGGTGPLPMALVERAESLFRELIPSQSEPALLHGDLHHYNILAAERSPWLAIDPRGVIGEPVFETGALLRNPLPQVWSWPDLPRVLTRRVDQLADELAQDRERIRGWGMAQAVLAAWWSVDEGGSGWEGHVTVARALAG